MFVEHYPEDVPGYASLEQNRKQLFALLEQLPGEKSFQGTQTFNFGKGRIIVGSDYHETLERTGVPAEELKTRWGYSLSGVHIRKDIIILFPTYRLTMWKDG